jgi:hypothetical protein
VRSGVEAALPVVACVVAGSLLSADRPDVLPVSLVATGARCVCAGAAAFRCFAGVDEGAAAFESTSGTADVDDVFGCVATREVVVFIPASPRYQHLRPALRSVW